MSVVFQADKRQDNTTSDRFDEADLKLCSLQIMSTTTETDLQHVLFISIHGLRGCSRSGGGVLSDALNYGKKVSV